MIRPFMLLLPGEATVLAGALSPWAKELGLPLDRYGRVDAQALAEQLRRRELGLTVQGAATFLQGLTAVDVAQMLAAGPRRPRVRELIRTGRLRYDRRDPLEWWQTWRELVAQLQAAPVAEGDCEDLGAAWAAETIVDGWDRDARAVAFASRPGLSHVVVRSPRYGDIDPSRLAGMGRE